MAGNKSRSKGQRFERAVCKAFEDTFGGIWRRTQAGESQDILGDVRPLGWDDFPFVVECKSTKDPFLDSLMAYQGPIKSWWEQTVEQTVGSDKLPLLVCKWDRHETYAVVNHRGLLAINGHQEGCELLPCLIFLIDKLVGGEVLYLMTMESFLSLLKEEQDRIAAGSITD